MQILLLQNKDIETNLGPPKEKMKNLSCCHWNVNNLIAHNLSKTSQLEADIKFTNIILSVYLRSILTLSVPEAEKNIHLDGYNLLKADHSRNPKCGGVCIFYKEILGVHTVNSLSFGECIISL